MTITYAALIGGVFLAMALAFGLGGREVAGQMLGDAYDKGQAQRGQVKQDMRTGKDRAQRDAQKAKDKADEHTNGTPDGRPNQPPAAYRA